MRASVGARRCERDVACCMQIKTFFYIDVSTIVNKINKYINKIPVFFHASSAECVHTASIAKMASACGAPF